jgi:hypothetical protein
VTEALCEFVKTQGLASTLDADGHRARHRTVELLDGVVRVEESVRLLRHVGVKTSDDCHASHAAHALERGGVSVVRVEFRRALALRSEIRRAGWFN